MFSPQKTQYPLFCGEITRREACSRFIFPHKNRSTHCFVGKSQGVIPALCSFFPTKTTVLTVLWGNQQVRSLLQVHFSPQKLQYPQFCGEITRRNACSRFIFPHKTRCTHHYVGKTPAHTPCIFFIYIILLKNETSYKNSTKKK